MSAFEWRYDKAEDGVACYTYLGDHPDVLKEGRQYTEKPTGFDTFLDLMDMLELDDRYGFYPHDHQK